MPCSDAQKRASTAYNRRQDNIMIRPSKAEGALIRAAAAEAGQSVQGYILDTLRARLQADGQLPPVPTPTDATPDEL